MISVIIPVYNAERYIKRAVDSVLAQDYRDFEIILVDDGSTDGSGRICDELAAKHNVLTVIHKANGGVGSARNAGIEVARGEYLTFVDSDDTVDSRMLGEIVRTFETTDVDRVLCGFEEVNENGTGIRHIADLPPRQVLDRSFVVDRMLYDACASNSYMNSVCGGGYKTDIIRRHDALRFEDRPMGEDWLFNVRYCEVAHSALYINEPYYKYMRNSASATHRYQPRQFELWLENRALRKGLADKYDFTLDRRSADSQWVIRVLYHALQVIAYEPAWRAVLAEMFRNEEFRSAVEQDFRAKPRYFAPVVWLLRKRWMKTAIMLLRLYVLRISIKR